MTVFDLTEIQANYILDMPLRRLTRFSRIELETEQDELERDDRGARPRSWTTRRCCGRSSPTSSPRSPSSYGTPRRTVLLESAGQPVAAAVPLEVADDPCLVLLSSTGLLARTTAPTSPAARGGARAKHDVVVVGGARPRRAARSGWSPAPGRLVRLGRARPARAAGDGQRAAPAGRGAGRASSCRWSRASGVAVPRRRWTTRLARPRARHRAQGVVKRVNPEVPDQQGRLGGHPARRRRQVVGAVELRTGDEELVFVTTDAQLLHFAAVGGPPAGPRPAAASPGIRLGRQAPASVFFGAVDAGRRRGRRHRRPARGAALPGTEAGAVKVTPFARVPRQGPRHRRGPLPPLPQGRGHPAAGLGRGRPGQARPRPAARRSTCPRPPVAGTARGCRLLSRSPRSAGRS